MIWHIFAVCGLGLPGQRPIPYQPWATSKVTRRHEIRGLIGPAHEAAGSMSDASWGGLSALYHIGLITTHGVAMGRYINGPLALKSAKSFSGIHGQFLENSQC